jgi:GTPase SAR1 family protein
MDLMTGGFLAGTVAALWSKLKILASKLNSTFFVSVTITKKIKTPFTSYLFREFKCSKFSKKLFVGKSEYIKPLQKNRLVAFEIPPMEPTVWWKGRKPLLVKCDSEMLYVTFVRGLFNINELIEEAIATYSMLGDSEKQEDRFFIIKKSGSIGSSDRNNRSGKKSLNAQDVGGEPVEYNGGIGSKYDGLPIKWNRPDLGMPRKVGAMESLALSKEILDAYYEAQRWKREEKWFKKRDVPWKRGWLLIGDPGTGKTAFTRALAQELNMPIVSFDLSTMTNKDFLEAWEDACERLPCIILFEDIDNVFQGRKNIATSNMIQGLSFDFLLNTLDGIDNTDGIFVIITTNNVESIDPALGNISNGMSTRPGRIDRVIKFKSLDNSGREKIANRIFEGVERQYWENVLEVGVKDTGAQFQERCARLALDLWEKNYVN